MRYTSYIVINRFLRNVMIIILCIISLRVMAQNLVPNGNFDNGTLPGYSNLPCGLVYNQYEYNVSVYPWILPTVGSSDVYASDIPLSCYCSMPVTTYNVPGLSPLGSQAPRSGHRFTGAYLYGPYSINNVFTPYREYQQVKLTSPLIPGEYYCAEMYVSLAERSGYAAGNIGMYFSVTNPSNVSSLAYFSYTPQVVETSVITDTINWVKISGVFQATQASEYLMIGNFNSGTQPFLKVNTKNVSEELIYSYYFFDDVSVTRLDISHNNLLSYTGNFSICQNESTQITVASIEEVTWTTYDDPLTVVSTGNTLIVSPEDTTSYIVAGRKCGYLFKDTIKVNVSPSPDVDLGDDYNICEGTTHTLDAGVFAQYLWQDQSTDEYYAVEQAGTYSVTVTNEYNCKDKDTIIIAVTEIPNAEIVTGTTIVCGELPTLAVASAPGNTYLWSTGSTDISIVAESSGSYWVKVENECGADSDTITMHFSSDVFIPNLVTLNHDNQNDRLVIKPENISGALTIYNIWGKEVFFSKAYHDNWPSMEISSGLYYYLYSFGDCPPIKGWIHIMGDEK